MGESGEELVRARIRDLGENTDFTSTLFGNLTGYAVIAADFDGNVIAYNEGARQVYGYDPEEVFGRQNIEAFFPPDFVEAGHFQRAVEVLLATGRFEYAGEKVRKGGQRFPAQVLFTLTKDRTGKVVGFVEIVQDLTERKRADAELRSHRDRLEVLVKNRTTELARANEVLETKIIEGKRMEVELRQRAEALVEADRRKDEFMAMLGHELRNPLAPIRNALHVLRTRGDNVPTVEWARAMVDRQVGHMTRIVDDLLDVSRISRGKIHLRTERLDLAGLIRDKVDDHRAALEEEARLTVDLRVDSTPIWVQGDPTRLSQVMDNFLHNASKFTDAGGRVMVRVAAHAEGRRAVVTVRDTGIGIEPELMPRLFDAFTQADSSLDRGRGGLGLGLALVKGLVQLHGGDVHASSAGTGRGTEFTFWLPLDREAPSLPRLALAPGDAPARRWRIIVIDDNQDAAESLRLVLEIAGHEVSVAYSGPAGVEAARRCRPQVVLCDIGLPGMDGYAVARELRRDPATASAHMIAVTGYGQEEDRRRAREAGFDLHLAKPVDPEQLRQTLASLAPRA